MAMALGVEASVGIAQALVFGWRGREGRIEQPHFIILKAHIQNSFLLPEKKYNGAADQRQERMRTCSQERLSAASA